MWNLLLVFWILMPHNISFHLQLFAMHVIIITRNHYVFEPHNHFSFVKWWMLCRCIQFTNLLAVRISLLSTANIDDVSNVNMVFALYFQINFTFLFPFFVFVISRILCHYISKNFLVIWLCVKRKWDFPQTFIQFYLYEHFIFWQKGQFYIFC